ncbi:GlsB/YeaQ/YmgE family stress response membrane protein [Mariprofundus ferrooxydans]|uniref:GlsB/YeaQ/YmgE family stress response membrane protein n=1 Tax=Mariprofundus ferrooxydans TaxID=314344 RepID=UPI0003747C0F|nr:GlsB/YeaQ/YmgE family stress response membrane protein [Mariprofundus ferrooxydans]
MNLVIFLLIGAVAGWIAGNLTKGGGFGLIGNMAIGVIGAFIGKFVFGFLGFSFAGAVGTLMAAILGAVILIFIVGLFKR